MLNDMLLLQNSISFGARLMHFILHIAGIANSMEKHIVNDTYNKRPAVVPKLIERSNTLEVSTLLGRKYWTIKSREVKASILVIYLHGGAYFANITHMHWRLIDQLSKAIGADFIVPDYPLAPQASCAEVFHFLQQLYAQCVSATSYQRIVLMGDSAGGGMALGFAQYIKSEKIQQPEHLILFSPWLDVTMTNPEIAKTEHLDKVLNKNALIIAGKKYAAELSTVDYRVSPIYGDFSGLGEIIVFVGTNELFLADVRKLNRLLHSHSIQYHMFEYPHMFHDWVLFSQLKESKQVMSWIKIYFSQMDD